MAVGRFWSLGGHAQSDRHPLARPLHRAQQRPSVCSLQVSPVLFLGPQKSPEQGPRGVGSSSGPGRSKPTAGALSREPSESRREPQGRSKARRVCFQHFGEEAVENVLWTAVSVAFWVLFFRTVVVEDLYLKHVEQRNTAMVQGLGGAEWPMFPHVGFSV